MSLDAGDCTCRYDPGTGAPESSPGDEGGEYDPYPARLKRWFATRLPGRGPGG